MKIARSNRINFIEYAISLLSNVVFQGVRYMSFGEAVYKASFTIVLAILINLQLGSILLSLIVGHIGNYILNGQFYVVYRHYSSESTMTMGDLNEYISIINRYINLFKPLDVLVIGSFCKGRMKSTSDLDLRIFHKPDLMSSIRAYIMATTLRFMGLFMKFPIDIYCFSDMRFLNVEKIKNYGLVSTWWASI